MTRLIDQYAQEIELICEELWTSSFLESVLDELDKKVFLNINRPDVKENGAWDIIDITDFLNNAQILVENDILDFTRSFSSIRWLWYIRRLPRYIFTGLLETTAPYDFLLAEALVTKSKNRLNEYSFDGNLLKFPVSRSIIKRVLKFCAKVLFLSHIHVSLRFAGKAAHFVFIDKGLPIVSVPDDLDQAIRLFDERNISKRGLLTHFGTVGSSETWNSNQSKRLILLLTWVTNSGWRKSYLGPLGEHKDVEVFVKFSPHLIDLDQSERLNSDPRLTEFQWWNDEVGQLVLFLSLMAPALLQLETSLVSLMQFGYTFVSIEFLTHQLEIHFDTVVNNVRLIFPKAQLPKSVNELLKLIDQMSSTTSLWPVINKKAIYRISTHGIYLDLLAMSQWLLRVLEFPKTAGAIANARSEHFELVTQEMINNTEWAPSPDLLKYRGRQLEFNGTRITDIDALGAQGKILLIVSCKSIIKPLLYDTGNYREVRNAYTKIEEAVKTWSTVKEKLITSPIGDNYDFSDFDTMLAVVCTNDTFFTPIGISTSFITEGLRAVVSFEELSDWLKSSVD